jgi:hypothetical protein
MLSAFHFFPTKTTLAPSSATDEDIAAKRSKGLEQLKQYANAHRMKDRNFNF